MEARKESYRRREKLLPSPAGRLADLFLSTVIDESARKGPVAGPAVFPLCDCPCWNVATMVRLSHERQKH
jgi:hypothetical protein